MSLTYSLHEDHVVPRPLTQNNGLVSRSGDTAERPRGRRRSDKSIHVSRKLSHSSFIAQQGACRSNRERLPLKELIMRRTNETVMKVK